MNSRITGNKRKWKIYSFDSILFEKIQYYDSLRVNFYIQENRTWRWSIIYKIFLVIQLQ